MCYKIAEPLLYYPSLQNRLKPTPKEKNPEAFENYNILIYAE
jgi:hypothetical protein